MVSEPPSPADLPALGGGRRRDRLLIAGQFPILVRVIRQRRRTRRQSVGTIQYRRTAPCLRDRHARGWTAGSGRRGITGIGRLGHMRVVPISQGTGWQRGPSGSRLFLRTADTRGLGRLHGLPLGFATGRGLLSGPSERCPNARLIVAQNPSVFVGCYDTSMYRNRGQAGGLLLVRWLVVEWEVPGGAASWCKPWRRCVPEDDATSEYGGKADDGALGL